MRLRLIPTSRSSTSLPGTSSAAAMKKAAEEKSPGTAMSPGFESLGGLDDDLRAAAAQRGPGRGQHALGVVARGGRLAHGRLAIGQAGPRAAGRTSPARLRSAARSRSRAAAPAVSSTGGSRRRGTRHPRPSPRADRRSRPTGRLAIDSSPSSDHSPDGCPASQPGRIRSRVPALPTSMRRRRRRRAAPPPRPPRRARRRPSGSPSVTTAPTPRTASRVERVSAESR